MAWSSITVCRCHRGSCPAFAPWARSRRLGSRAGPTGRRTPPVPTTSWTILRRRVL